MTYCRNIQYGLYLKLPYEQRLIMDDIGRVWPQDNQCELLDDTKGVAKSQLSLVTHPVNVTQMSTSKQANTKLLMSALG